MITIVLRILKTHKTKILILSLKRRSPSLSLLFSFPYAHVNCERIIHSLSMSLHLKFLVTYLAGWVFVVSFCFSKDEMFLKTF